MRLIPREIEYGSERDGLGFRYPSPPHRRTSRATEYAAAQGFFFINFDALAQHFRVIAIAQLGHKEIFNRELVSNASDALDKLRLLSVTDPSLLGDAGELEIRIKPDPEKWIITILDTGIGMIPEELIGCLGTIAQSGTSKFLNALKFALYTWSIGEEAEAYNWKLPGNEHYSSKVLIDERRCATPHFRGEDNWNLFSFGHSPRNLTAPSAMRASFEIRFLDFHLKLEDVNLVAQLKLGNVKGILVLKVQKSKVVHERWRA
ncbi:hypothetical protein L1987_72076 [Smallanthus sonchifolius]|uniref:Uncharacterized protein n=1 Tax=Smallanthus sonchifolius TaxID=185202 RepID=A0ACB9AUV0_9ASTR|nr:hypothetical protein L1987_72076 [Smallanthus sonchifolius]